MKYFPMQLLSQGEAAAGDPTTWTTSNPDKAILLAKRASAGGFILNSVKTQCTFVFEVVD